jgi:hypothetical protein
LLHAYVFLWGEEGAEVEEVEAGLYDFGFLFNLVDEEVEPVSHFFNYYKLTSLKICYK